MLGGRVFDDGRAGPVENSNTCGTITDVAREVEETGAVEEATCIIAT